MGGIGTFFGNGDGEPVSIVRDETGAPQSWTPVLVLGGGLLTAAVLVVAAIRVRRKAPGREPRAVTRRSELDTLAKALRIGRAERRAVRSLADMAGVREPAVLLLSEHAFDRAAHAVRGRLPGGAEGLNALRASLGYGPGPGGVDTGGRSGVKLVA